MGQRVGANRFGTAGASGFPFIEARRTQALEAAQKGLSTETPEQLRIRQTLQGQLGQRAAGLQAGAEAAPQFQQQFGAAIGQRLAGFGAGETSRRAVFEAEQQRGLEQSLTQARRQLGGTGVAGSSQAGRAIGGIIGQAQESRSRGLLDLRSQGIQELGALQGLQRGGLQDLLSISAGQRGLAGQDIAERQFESTQALSLAQLLQQQAESELGRQGGLRNVGQGGLPQPSDFATGLGGLAGIAGTVGGFAVGGPLGGSIGGNLLSGIGGAKKPIVGI